MPLVHLLIVALKSVQEAVWEGLSFKIFIREHAIVPFPYNANMFCRYAVIPMLCFHPIILMLVVTVYHETIAQVKGCKKRDFI